MLFKFCLPQSKEEILPADGVLVTHGHPFFALGQSSFHAPQKDLNKRSSSQVLWTGTRQKQQREFCGFC